MKKLVLGLAMCNVLAVVAVEATKETDFDTAFQEKMKEVSGSDGDAKIVVEHDLDSYVSDPLTYYGQKEITKDNTYLFVFKSSGFEPEIMPVAANSKEMAEERFKIFSREQSADIELLMTVPLNKVV